MAAWQLSKALYTARINGWHRFVTMQNHYNLVYREEERETIPLCIDQGLALIPWSPLARGFLAGTRNKEGGETIRSKTDTYAREMYFTADDFAVADAVAAVARERGVAPAQNRVRMDLTGPRRNRADYRCDANRTTSRTDRRYQYKAYSRGGFAARGTVSSPSCSWKVWPAAQAANDQVVLI